MVFQASNLQLSAFANFRKVPGDWKCCKMWCPHFLVGVTLLPSEMSTPLVFSQCIAASPHGKRKGRPWTSEGQVSSPWLCPLRSRAPSRHMWPAQLPASGSGTNSLHQAMRLKSESSFPQTEQATPTASHHHLSIPKASWGFPCGISELDMGCTTSWVSTAKKLQENCSCLREWDLSVLKVWWYLLALGDSEMWSNPAQCPDSFAWIINIFLGSELSQQIAVKASRDLKTRTERCRGVCCSSSWICEI